MIDVGLAILTPRTTQLGIQPALWLGMGPRPLATSHGPFVGACCRAPLPGSPRWRVCMLAADHPGTCLPVPHTQELTDAR